MKLNYDLHSLHEITMLGCLAFEQQLEFNKIVRRNKNKIEMRREPGYYWVRHEGKWEISIYDDWNYWHTIGQVDSLTDAIWEEINETRIKEPSI